MVETMGDITEVLAAIEQGDGGALDRLLPLVYDELRALAARKIANERPGQTLQATALVHEAYIRLFGAKPGQHWDSRRHFFGAAAEAMRRLLINRARDKSRRKRGGSQRRINLEQIEIAVDTPSDELLVLDEALQALSVEHALAADLVKLRFFAGLTMEEAAKVLDVSGRTADRYWAFGRAWLYERLQEQDEAGQE